MAFITDIFGSGVVNPANNEALQRLSALLGTNLVFGSSYSIGAGGAVAASGNDNNTLLLLVSSALSPIYLAILFLILGWIAVGGTVKSALDGEFLGRDWSSFGVPASLIVSILMLSPVPNTSPSGGGITLAQVVYVKAIVLGSNFGDLILKTAYEQSVQQAQNHANQNQMLKDPSGAAQLQAEKYKQVSDRMQMYLKNYLCAEQLIASGVNHKFTFFMSLDSTCKVPVGSQHLYTKYFSYDFKRWTGSYDANGNPTYTTVKAALPPSITDNASKNVSAREYDCYYSAFTSTYTSPAQINQELLNGFNLGANRLGIKTPSIYPSSQSSTVITDAGSTMKQVTVDSATLLAGWLPAVSKGVQCLDQAVPTKNNVLAYYLSKPDPITGIGANQQSTPWGHGWSAAAQLMRTDLNNANAVPGYPLAITEEVVQPNLNNAAKTEGGPALRNSLENMESQLVGFKDKANSLLKTVSYSITSDSQSDPASVQIGQTASNTPGTGSVSMPGHGNYTDARRILSAGAMIGIVSGLSDAGVRAKTAAAFADKFKSGLGGSFLRQLANTLGTKAANAAVNTVGSNVQAARTASKALDELLTDTKIVSTLQDDTRNGLSNQPVAGAGVTVAGVAAKGILMKVTSIFVKDGVVPLLFMGLTLLNIMTLAPEIAMTLALLIWILRVAAWFLIVPISAVLIALPKTNIGHNAWKEGLALALTPAITALFFLVSMLMFDVVIDVSFQAMFTPYTAAFSDSGVLSGILKFTVDLLTGEIVYRLLAFIALVAAGFFFTIYLILRGPTWALRHLGLSGSDDFSGQIGQMEGLIKRPKSAE